MEGGVGDLRLLGLVDLEGVVDVRHGVAVGLLAAVKANAKEKGLDIVRGLLELLVHKVERLALVPLLVKGLPGPLEVVVIAGFAGAGLGGSLGERLAAGQGQQKR